ncbi:MAG: hypothetical protein A3E79_02455 [Burkholderiales bacterium RIFCSPHIGHO2_12_FULL_61_11]|nr:MAG: hypothetical protein A3E79_02455 [Burkholderiales bacterium RIFCSPHIGHO2_12_FULL_61_11]
MHINTNTHDTGATPSPEQRIVFIDCEFTDLADPKLLSIGLLADDGRELYVELTGAGLLTRLSPVLKSTHVGCLIASPMSKKQWRRPGGLRSLPMGSTVTTRLRMPGP